MKTSALLIGCAAALLLVPPPAVAGGWWTWIHLERATVAPGQKLTARADVMFDSAAEAEAAAQGGKKRDAFYVYLLRGFDHSMVERAMREPFSPDWWSVGNADAYELDRVLVTVTDLNLARATASFGVPDDLPPGEYAVMFCDAGCIHPLANVTPASPNLTVTAAATTGVSPWRKAGWLTGGVILGTLLGFLGFAYGVRARRGSPDGSLRPVTR